MPLDLCHTIQTLPLLQQDEAGPSTSSAITSVTLSSKPRRRPHAKGAIQIMPPPAFIELCKRLSLSAESFIRQEEAGRKIGDALLRKRIAAIRVQQALPKILSSLALLLGSSTAPPGVKEQAAWVLCNLASLHSSAIADTGIVPLLIDQLACVPPLSECLRTQSLWTLRNLLKEVKADDAVILQIVHGRQAHPSPY